MTPDKQLRTLLAEIRNGSEEAAQQVVQEYLPHVLRVVRRTLNPRLRAKFDSMDFAQAVWASVLGCREQIVSIETPEAWTAFLTAVARNKVVDEFRRRLETEKHNLDREVSISDSRTGVSHRLISREPTPSETAVAKEKWEQLTAGLSDQHREIVRLKMQGETCQGVADLLGINEKTVRRVLKKLELEDG